MLTIYPLEHRVLEGVDYLAIDSHQQRSAPI